MSLNPPLFNDRSPKLLAGEQYLCQCSKTAFKATADNLPNLKCRDGTVYLTRKRLIYVPRKPVKSGRIVFKSFDISLENLSNVKFNQPIFGSNYLSGDCSSSSRSQGYVKFKIYFSSGGTSGFLAVFMRALEEARIPVAETVPDNFSDEFPTAFETLHSHQSRDL